MSARREALLRVIALQRVLAACAAKPVLADEALLDSLAGVAASAARWAARAAEAAC